MEAVKTEVEVLISKNIIIAHQAAYRLLSCYGSTEAYQIRQTLPEKTCFHPITYQELYLKDPCSDFSCRGDRKKLFKLS